MFMKINRIWYLEFCKVCLNMGRGSYLVVESNLGRIYLSNN